MWTHHSRRGDTDVLGAVKGFGANPYTDDEKITLSEIVRAFNEYHGTDFTDADITRFEPINVAIMDEELKEMLRNNPPDVVYEHYKKVFFQMLIKTLNSQQDMSNIILNDTDRREMFIKFFFGRALREVQETT